ncbi:MAG TPA: hypothetical protein VGF76_06925, partial [Polyangiaceae bacterium]
MVAVAGLRTTLAAAQAAAPAAPAAADDADEDSDDANAAKPAAEAPKKPVEAAAPTPAPVVVSAEKTAEPARSPLSFGSAGWSGSIYGFSELDVMSDSTQSFSENVGNQNIARPNTVAGDNPRTQFTARNSRLGFKIAAPEWDSVKASAVIELDFFGGEPLTTSQGESYTAGPMRMRHFYAKVETPIVDVLAGQYHDLFAWGGAGFYPNSVAFLPLLGQIYHRNPQFRLS